MSLSFYLLERPFKIAMPCFLLACLSLHSNQAAAQKITPRLNHIALHVYDLKKSADFYEHLLSFDTIPEPFHDGKHVWLHLGPQEAIHLIEGATSVSSHAIDTHLCYSVPSLSPVIEKLKEAGVNFRDWAGHPQSITRRPDGVNQIYFTDPDGYWIEVNDARQ